MLMLITVLSIAFASLAVAWLLAYHNASGIAWSIGLAAIAALITFASPAPPAVYIPVWVVVGAFALFAIVTPLRAALVTGPIFGIYKKILPQISQTEQEALDAGSIWWDADLFSGKPDWKKMLAYPEARLTAEEKAFVDGPVEELCGMLDEWDIVNNRMDL